MTLKKWQAAWREHVAPQLPENGLRALRHALESDDPALLQGVTTEPPCPAEFSQPNGFDNWQCEAACAAAYAIWRGWGNDEHLWTIANIMKDAGFTCWNDHWVDFTEWYDNAPRTEMRQEMLKEVDLELQRRASALVAT